MSINRIAWEHGAIQVYLLKGYYLSQPYKKSIKDKEKAWIDVKNYLFNQDIMQQYVALRDSETMLRNIKSNFKTIYQKVLTKFGITSGHSSNLSKS